MQKRLVLAAITLLVAPVVIVAQKTSYDYEKTANFAAFKTYAHKQGTPVGQSLIDDRIVAAIDAQLAAKGLIEGRGGSRRVRRLSHGLRQGEGHLDLQLRLRRRLRRLRVGMGRRLGGGTTTTQVRDILIGTLVIDMADARKGQLVWRGMGVKEVNTQANPEKRDKSINKAVEKIFKNYPPKVKK